MNVTVNNCVSYHTRGHAFFLEDGLERGCTFTNNLGISTLAEQAAVINSVFWPLLHKGDKTPVTFWITTMNCTVEDNISAGSEGSGFWVENPHESHFVQGMDVKSMVVDLPNEANATSAAQQPVVWKFNRNRSHSNIYHGLFSDHRPYMFGLGSTHGPHAFVAHDFTAYKCGQYGIFTRNFGHVVWEKLRIADCQVGLYAATTAFPTVDGEGTTTFKDALLIGDSRNLGSDFDADEIQVQRSLFENFIGPNADGGIYGFELYDGLVILDDVEFSNYEDLSWTSNANGSAVNHARFSAAIVGRLIDLRYAIDPRNTVMNTTFEDVTRRVFFRTPADPTFNVGNLVTIWDADGSITGFPNYEGPNGTVAQDVTGAYIVADQPVMLPDNAAKNSTIVKNDAIWRTEWNSWILPDLPPSVSPTGLGQRLVQVIFRDKDLSYGYTSSSNPSPNPPIPAYMTLTRIGSSSSAQYQSHHIETTSQPSVSNNYPFNVLQGYVYEVGLPTAAIAVNGATPAVVPVGNFDVTVRFGRPGDWITLKVPVGANFDPVAHSSTEFVQFIYHQRIDCALFATSPVSPLPLGTSFPPTIPPASPATEYLPYPAAAPLADTSFNMLTPTSVFPLALPESTSIPNVGPSASAVNQIPFEFAWHYDGSNFLYLRIVLTDSGPNGPFATGADLVPGVPGSGILLPGWFLPQNYSATIDAMYEGGAVRVHFQR